MQFFSTILLAALAVFAIGILDVSATPIRYVTPKPGVNYKIRVVTPKPGIRYARSIDEDEFSADPNVEISSLRNDRLPRAAQTTERVQGTTEGRGREIIIDANSPQAQETELSLEKRRILRSVEAIAAAEEDEIFKALNTVEEIQHAISKRSPERVVINYKPPPPNGPRYARFAEIEDIEE